ncbi:MAG TPA: MarR family transcriptional regulator [Armatimonadota bacterium]|nr:MarR family transcriptional regulator [Armatimonadota bacterium]
MKLLEKESICTESALLAGEVMETACALAYVFRTEIHRMQHDSMTLSQFRALSYIEHSGSPSLSQLAEVLGVTLPSASKIVDDLVAAGYVTRAQLPENRRMLAISISESGSRWWPVCVKMH